MRRGRAHHARDEGVEAAWHEVHSGAGRFWARYGLAEKLVDLVDSFRRWLFDHVTTVERVIGFKRGSSGVSDLRRILDVDLFPELWSIRGGL